MIVVLILTLAVAAAGASLIIYMMRRKDARYGLMGLLALITAGMVGLVYGVLASIETIP